MAAIPQIQIGNHTFLLSGPAGQSVEKIAGHLSELPSPFGEKKIALIKPEYKSEPFHKSIVRTLLANEEAIIASNGVLGESEKTVIVGMTRAYQAAFKDGVGKNLDISGITHVVNLLADYYIKGNKHKELYELIDDVFNRSKDMGIDEEIDKLALDTYSKLAKNHNDHFNGKIANLANALEYLFREIGIDTTESNTTAAAEGKISVETILANGIARRMEMVNTKPKLKEYVKLSAEYPGVNKDVAELYKKCIADETVLDKLWERVELHKKMAGFAEGTEKLFSLIEERIDRSFTNPYGIEIENAYLVPNGMQAHAEYKSGESVKSLGVTNTGDHTYLILRNKETGYTSLVAVNPRTEKNQVRAAIRHFNNANQNVDPKQLEVTLIGASSGLVHPDKQITDVVGKEDGHSQVCLHTALMACSEEKVKITSVHIADNNIPASFCVDVAPGEMKITNGLAKNRPDYFDVYTAYLVAANEPNVTDIAFDESKPFRYNPLLISQNHALSLNGLRSEDPQFSRILLMENGLDGAMLPVLSHQLPKMADVFDNNQDRCLTNPIKALFKHTKKALRLPDQGKLTACTYEGCRTFAIAGSNNFNPINESLAAYTQDEEKGLFTLKQRRFAQQQAAVPTFAALLDAPPKSNSIFAKKSPPSITSGSILSTSQPAFTAKAPHSGTVSINNAINTAPDSVVHDITINEQGVAGYYNKAFDAAKAFSSVAQYTSDLKLEIPPQDFGTSFLGTNTDERTTPEERVAAR